MKKTISKENGAILIGDLPDKPGGRAQVHIIIVPESVRRRGIGQQLLQEFEQAARSVRASRIETIFCNFSTTAEIRKGLIGLFTKQGYQEESDLGLGPLFFKKVGRNRRR